jgi:hypothetical protein
VKRALLLAAGVILWALHFGAIYGYAGLACARGWERSVTPVVAALTVAAALAATAFMVVLRRREGFEHAIAIGLAGFALLAIVWEGASVAFLVPCASR